MIGRILLSIYAALFLLITPALAEKRVALVLGNSAYSSVDALPNPARDADAVAAKLADLGFEIVIEKNADRDQMNDAMGRFITALQGADVGLFYYAGHGIQYDGRNYLIGTAAKADNQFALTGGSLALDEVIEAMEATTPTNLVFLDACRDNPFVAQLKKSLPASRSTVTSTGLAPVKSQQGRDTMIVYATAANNVAADGEGEYSPFATALLKHIATPGVEVSLVIKKVIQDVRLATQYEQNPEILSAMAAEFYFAGPTATPAAPAPDAIDLSVPTENSENRDPTSDAELTAYKVAFAKNTAEGWHTFLDGFPDGVLAPYAQDALIGIEGNEATFNPSVSFEDAETQLRLTQVERAAIQTTLAALGYDIGTPDGAFGKRTRQALLGFQLEAGLMPTGYLDASTRAKLNSEDVQQNAARSFQAATGLVGAAAEKALNLTSEEIELIKLGLAANRLSVDPGKGVLGQSTRASIRQLQFKEGLDTSGFLSAELASELLTVGRRAGVGLARYVDPLRLAEGVDPRLKLVADKFLGRPIKYGYFGNSLYVVVIQDTDYDRATELAASVGGHLLVFSSAAEKAFVDSLVDGDRRFYHCDDEFCTGPTIGYFQQASAKRSGDGWTSVTGEPVSLQWDTTTSQPNEMELANAHAYAAYGNGGQDIRFTICDMRRFEWNTPSAIIEIPITPQVAGNSQ